MSKNIFIAVFFILLAIAYYLFANNTKEPLSTDDGSSSVKIVVPINKSKTPLKDRVEENVKTPLNVVLFSTILGETKHAAIAYISYNNAPEQLYIVGFLFSEGVQLTKIAQDHVIIDNKGILEKFVIKDQAVNKKSTPKTSIAIKTNKKTEAVVSPSSIKVKPKPLYDKDALPPIGGDTPPPPPPQPLLPALPKLEPVSLPGANDFLVPPDDGSLPPLDN